MSQDEPVLVTERLTKKYGRLTALDGLSIALERGQILGFIGPNGAGKTTTIKILVGLARPTSGSARVAGADCVRDARKIRDIPITIINGRYDMVCPPVTAWRLHQRLPKSKLIIVEKAGHSEGEEGTTRALIEAVAEFE